MKNKIIKCSILVLFFFNNPLMPMESGEEDDIPLAKIMSSLMPEDLNIKKIAVQSLVHLCIKKILLGIINQDISKKKIRLLPTKIYKLLRLSGQYCFDFLEALSSEKYHKYDKEREILNYVLTLNNLKSLFELTLESVYEDIFSGKTDIYKLKDRNNKRAILARNIPPELFEKICSNSLPYYENTYGFSCFEYGVVKNKTILRNMHGLGIDMNIGNNMFLRTAVNEQECEIVKFLILLGADVNGKCGTKQQTPLHIACITGNEEIIEFLLQKQANPNLLDIHQSTPLDYVQKNRDKIEDLFKKYSNNGNRIALSNNE